ncbi:MAG: flagellar biosynthetic protein FliR [Bdellovibrionaceae bacterium]|nr:flagellar biosynthetic protein FliR [Pseudobdellovibrionaceae bacterium]
MFQNLFVNESLMIVFVLVLIRISSFLLSSSLFSSYQVSAVTKILISLVLTLIAFETYKTTKVPMDALIIILALKEVFLGVCLGMLTRFFFFALNMASEMTSQALGLSSASIFNPMSGINSSLIEQFQNTLAILVFFAIQGHHLLITAVFQSFELISISQMTLKFGGLGEFAIWCQKLFEIALKVSAPVVSSLFLVNLGMGILGRAVPQINVFVTSFQVTIIVGFLVVMVSMPLYLNEVLQIFDLTQTQLFKMMRSF